MRFLRAVLLAGVIVGIGSLAHVSAAGSVPGTAEMVTLYVLVAAVCAALLGREASTLRLVALTVGGQSAVHGAVSAMSGHTGAAGHAGMGHDTVLTASLAELGANPVMAAVHLAAALVVALWLAVGERALWSLLTLARSTARGVLGQLVLALRLHPVVLRAVPRVPRLSPARVEPRPQLPLWSRGPARRGPPMALLPH